MKRFLFILTLALVALAGCKKDPAPGQEPGTEQEPGTGQDAPISVVFKTSKAVGETITLGFDKYEIANVSVDGAKPKSGLANGNWRLITYELTSQAVTVRGDITVFHCRDNGINDITLTKDLKLFDFDCSGNELTSLDVSGLEKLEILACTSNNLTSLNIEGCESLYYVECYRNSIKDEAMTDIVNDLPTLGTPGTGRLVVMADDCDNVITEDDADIAISKNWDVMDNQYNNVSFPSANCYIVSEQGTYSFKTVKGNSSESVGNVASAKVLWETFGTDVAPAVGDLVKSVSYSNGKITYTATGKKGNAVIAAKDAAGNILWSWHIWLTDQPKEQEYNHNAGTMMDRNLGATSSTPGDVGALGLLYQWGRKDPFLGSSSISSSTVSKSTIIWPSAVSSDSSSGTIAYAIANPTTFIAYNKSNYDWYYTGSSSTDNTRWTTSESSKSIYDPCPSGWRVPDGGDNGIWSKAGFNNTTYDSTNQGISFSISSPSKTWYPASGYLGRNDGGLNYVGFSGYFWSASPYSNCACFLYLSYSGSVYPSDYWDLAFGHSVRCIKD